MGGRKNIADALEMQSARVELFANPYDRINELENLVGELASVLKVLVVCNETHNQEIIKIIGRPPNWNDAYLNMAREVLKKIKECDSK